MASNGQSRVDRKKQAKTKKKPLWKRIMKIALIVILIMGIGVGGLFSYYILTAPSIDAEKLTDPFASVLLDENGEPFADLYDEQRIKIEYDDLPDLLVDAVVATEDSRFFKHPGIDIRRIGGAIKANLTRGFGSEGASTITQQVAENAFLTNEKKIKLKVQEQWLALKLERQYTKEQILEMYLNKIFYGSNSYGVAKAAETYFGKEDLHDLTLPEAAILAGLPQRPSAYNPYEHPDLAADRMDTVLNLMVRHGKITEEQADEAREVDIDSLLAGKKPDSKKYEAFIQEVEGEIKEKVDGADIYTDGLTVHTTLNPDAQSHVEHLLSDSEDNPISYPENVIDEEGKEHKMEAGLVVLDTELGSIQAIGGSRDNDISQNYALNRNRQPGSTYKPILAYGPAIEYEKWSTYHQLNDDKPYEIAGSSKTVRNWNRQYQGWMSARYALTWSLNVPTLKTIEEVGPAKAQKFAEGLGLKFEDSADIQAAIGSGKSSAASPLELAGAYQALGNEGIHTEPHAVTKVEFPDGKTVDLKPEAKAAMSDSTAYMVTDMLKSVITEGTGKDANVPGLPVAGKTGTTSRPGVEGSPDSWFAGYTTNYTIAIWTGFKDNNISLPDTKVPHALFKNIMTELSKDKETKNFVKPDSVVEVSVEKGSNPPKLASEYTPSSSKVTELFVKGTEPKQVSETYDKLDPVSSLEASYVEDDELIQVGWDYNSDENDVQFEVALSTDGSDMKVLQTSEDKSMEIKQVQAGKDYIIQVVAVKDDNRSEAKTVNVTLEDKEEEEKMIPVDNLQAEYNENASSIDVNWDYDGPPASFEVNVNGQTQTVNSNGIDVTGAQPGIDYTITVTPIGKEGVNDGIKGDSEKTSIRVPKNDNEEKDSDNQNQEQHQNQEEQHNQNHSENQNQHNDNQSDQENQENNED